MSICVFILGQGSNCCESSKTLQSSLLQTPDSNVEVVAFIEEDSELLTLPLRLYRLLLACLMRPLPYWRKMMWSKDGDFYLLAKSSLDCREHKRAAHVLPYCHCSLIVIFCACKLWYISSFYSIGSFMEQSMKLHGYIFFKVLERWARMKLEPKFYFLYMFFTREIPCLTGVNNHMLCLENGPRMRINETVFNLLIKLIAS